MPPFQQITLIFEGSQRDERRMIHKVQQADTAPIWDSYIDADEVVFWKGRPARQLFVLRPIDLFLVPFSIVWAMGAMMAIPQLLLTSGLPFNAVGLLFLAAAGYVTIGRFLLDRHIRRRTFYAVTEKRALILTTAFTIKMRELPITPALAIEFSDSSKGSVWLGERSSFLSGMQSIGIWHGDDGGFTFRAIQNPRVVFDLIRNIKRSDSS